MGVPNQVKRRTNPPGISLKRNHCMSLNFVVVKKNRKGLGR